MANYVWRICRRYTSYIYIHSHIPFTMIPMNKPYCWCFNPLKHPFLEGIPSFLRDQRSGFSSQIRLVAASQRLIADTSLFWDAGSWVDNEMLEMQWTMDQWINHWEEHQTSSTQLLSIAQPSKIFFHVDSLVHYIVGWLMINDQKITSLINQLHILHIR